MESGETLLNNHWLGNRGESLSFLVGTISKFLVMEIGWTDVGSGGYILGSCAHSNTSSICIKLKKEFHHSSNFISNSMDVIQFGHYTK